MKTIFISTSDPHEMQYQTRNANALKIPSITGLHDVSDPESAPVTFIDEYRSRDVPELFAGIAVIDLNQYPAGIARCGKFHWVIEHPFRPVPDPVLLPVTCQGQGVLAMVGRNIAVTVGQHGIHPLSVLQVIIQNILNPFVAISVVTGVELGGIGAGDRNVVLVENLSQSQPARDQSL